jgi:hypothetical protein
MNVEKLIHWLSSHHIEVLEDRTLADGSRIITFTAALPLGQLDGRHVWYPIVLSKDQTEVSRAEIEALLRHLWHGELEIPDDLPPV